MTILMGFAAINTGNNLMYLLVSFLLAIMGISGFYGLKNIGGFEFTISPAIEIYANRETYISVEIVNKKKWMPSMLLWVGIDDNFKLINFIRSGQKITLKIAVVFNSRGINNIDQIVVASRYPFNFFIRKNVIQIGKSVLVFPEPVKCESIKSFYDKSRQAGDQNASNIDSREELSGIRQYAEGDKIRDIHWKHYARSFSLKTKEYSGQSSKPVMIEIDEIEASNMEESLSKAVYMILQILNNGIPVGLKLNDIIIKPNIGIKHKIDMLNKLAEYD